MAVGEVEYQRLVAAVDGLVLTWADHDSVLAEARRRGDGATEVMLLLLAGVGSEDEDAACAAALRLAATATARRELIVRLARWRDEEVAWHLLVALAEAYPEELPLLEAALASWSDSARQSGAEPRRRHGLGRRGRGPVAVGHAAGVGDMVWGDPACAARRGLDRPGR
jgi:hypothetical protein